MMDELEVLKKDWQKREESLPRLSYEEIHRMIWKKSSSLVRWIFYISILEFLVPHLLYLIPSFRNGMSTGIAEALGIQNILVGLTVIQYGVAIYFIAQFYRRYKEISVLESAGALMDRILRTRRTVKHYVIFALSMVLVFFAVFIGGMYFSDNLTDILNLSARSDVNPERLKALVIGIMAIAGIVITVIMGGLYFLLYGLLTRRLYYNYKDLKRMDD